MRRLLLLGVAVLASGCAVGPRLSQAPACSGSPNEPVGCVARIRLGGTAYLDRGYVALTDDAKVKLAAAGTLTAAIEWLPSPDPNAAPMLPVPAEAEFAGASVWTVPGIDPKQLVLLGPFPQDWEAELVRAFPGRRGIQGSALGALSEPQARYQGQSAPGLPRGVARAMRLRAWWRADRRRP